MSELWNVGAKWPFKCKFTVLIDVSKNNELVSKNNELVYQNNKQFH